MFTTNPIDGTVSVCDLEEVRRRLDEVGLGWEPHPFRSAEDEVAK